MEIKNCPFCKSNAIVNSSNRAKTTDSIIFKIRVDCCTCGAKGPVVTAKISNFMPEPDIYEKAKNRAIEKWNRRV